MLKGDKITIYGSGEQVRDYVYVTDCAAANVLALKKGNNEVFNIGSGIGTTVNQIFQHLKEITNYPRTPIYAPPRLGETFKIYLNATKAHNQLNWQQTIDLHEGLTRTVNYIKETEG